MPYREDNDGRAIKAFLPHNEYHPIDGVAARTIQDLSHSTAKTGGFQRSRMAKRQSGKSGDFIKQTLFPGIRRILSIIVGQSVVGSLYFGKRPVRETQAIKT